jgi:hypothetical protein
MGTLSLSDAQQRAYNILVRVQGGKLAPLDGAVLLGCSVRHLRRQVARLPLEGMGAVVHGNRGRSPSCKTPVETIERIRTLLEDSSTTNVWPTLNVCHLQERLAEKEGIELGRSTLDRLLANMELRRRGRSRAQRRCRREPAPAKGMIIQIDGSSHAWFQERGGRTCLMASIDDATGEVVYAHFQKSEDQAGYLRMIQQIAVTFGLPMAYYHDKHTILRSPAKATVEEEIAGDEPMSKVQRVLRDLGVESIAAHSPQAKGRIERLFKTFQDRLLKEMAFEGIATCKDANVFLEKYIPVHNARFARAPKDPEPAWVPLDGADIFYYCSVLETRSVRNDHTVAWYGKTLQIVGTEYLSGKSVDVRTDYTGGVRIYVGKTQHNYKEIERFERIKPTPATSAQPENATDKKPQPRGKWLYGRNRALTPEMLDLMQKAQAIDTQLYKKGQNH